MKVHETEVDGVRCFWVDSGRPTLAASLIFRAGKVDETASTSGWMHLLEHMALHESSKGGALSVNGSVSLLDTRFDAHGPPAQVVDHLLATTSRLSMPTFEHLSRERDVLQAEARLRSGEVLDALLWRYGTRGPGLAGFAELGLGRANAVGLTQLSSQVFTRANAAIALDGPPPKGLRIDLPDGDHVRPIPVAVPCSGASAAAYPDRRGLVASGTTPRSPAATLFPLLLQRSLQDRLRHQDGAAYAPWSHYEPVDDTTALIVAGSDVSERHAASATSTLVEIVDGIRREGPATEHVRDVVTQVVQQMRDPYNISAFAWRAATRHLHGAPTETIDEILDEIASVTDQEILAVTASFRDSLLIGSPDLTALPDGLQPVRRPIVEAHRGRRFPHKNWPGDRVLFSISDDAVQLVLHKEAIGVKRKEITGLALYPNGSRAIIGADGWNLVLDPNEWHYGDDARLALEHAIPQRLHLPQSAELQPESSFTRNSFWVRWFSAYRQSAALIFGSICLLLAAGCIALGVVTDKWWFFYVAALFAGQLIYAFASEDEPKTTGHAWSRFGDGY